MALPDLTAAFLANPRVERARAYGMEERAILSVAAGRDAMQAIAAWPGYGPTPLHSLAPTAEEAGVAEVL